MEILRMTAEKNQPSFFNRILQPVPFGHAAGHALDIESLRGEDVRGGQTAPAGAANGDDLLALVFGQRIGLRLDVLKRHQNRRGNVAQLTIEFLRGAYVDD